MTLDLLDIEGTASHWIWIRYIRTFNQRKHAESLKVIMNTN